MILARVSEAIGRARRRPHRASWVADWPTRQRFRRRGVGQGPYLCPIAATALWPTPSLRVDIELAASRPAI